MIDLKVGDEVSHEGMTEPPRVGVITRIRWCGPEVDYYVLWHGEDLEERTDLQQTGYTRGVMRSG